MQAHVSAVNCCIYLGALSSSLIATGPCTAIERQHVDNVAVLAHMRLQPMMTLLLVSPYDVLGCGLPQAVFRVAASPVQAVTILISAAVAPFRSFLP